MNQEQTYKHHMWRQYVTKVYLLRHGELDPFEKEFVASCWKACLQLSAKQQPILDRIIGKYFK